MIFAFFRFSSVETQARFNTDVLFVGMLAMIGILILVAYALSRVQVVFNDVKTVLKIAMAYDASVGQQVREGKIEITQKVEETKQTLGGKIEEVKDAVSHSSGGSGVNLG